MYATGFKQPNVEATSPAPKPSPDAVGATAGHIGADVSAPRSGGDLP